MSTWTVMASAVTVTLLVTLLPSLTGAQELFSPLSSLCCSGKVITRERDVSMCCGDAVFDPTEELCCSNKVLKLPADPPGALHAPLVPMGHFRPGAPVYFSARSVLYGCCGDAIFNVEKQLCCNGKIRDKPANASRDTYFACCDDDVYDASEQECCRGRLLPKTKLSEGCCGDKVIDYAEQICCLDYFFDTTEMPVVYDRDTPDVSCCGRQRIHFNNEICCGGKVVPVPADPVDRSRAMCCGKNLWVGNGTDLCCNGQILPRKSFDETCCGSDVIDMTTHICCDGVVLPKKTNQTFCCGPRTYESNLDACCYSNFTTVSLGNSLDTNLDAMACCE